MIRDPCPECDGEGRARREKVLGLKIPAGVDDGTRLRVTGEGEAGPRGGPPGDLYVVLRVREPERERSFRVPGYPWLSLLFCVAVAGLVVSTILERPLGALVGAGLVLSGIPVYWLLSRRQAEGHPASIAARRLSSARRRFNRRQPQASRQQAECKP